MNSRRQSIVMLAFGAVLVTLLATLAVLQYRWVGQVSDAERERLRAGIRRSAEQFENDFDREITRAYTHFQVAPDGRSNLDETYTRRYAEWRQSAAHADLVSAILCVEGDVQRVRKLDPGRGVLADAALPPQIAQGLTAGHGPGGWLRPGPIDSGAPALIVPALTVFSATEQLTKQPPHFNPPALFTVVQLNGDYLRNTFLPALVRSHFGEDGDYFVTVVERANPEKVVYRSSGAPVRDSADLRRTAEVSAGILGVKLPDVATLLRERFSDPESGTSKNLQIRILTHENRVVVNSRPTRASGVFIGGDTGETWEVLLHHRGGSLDAAVNQLRRRNLGISFGILAILAVASGMVLITAARAGRLARQQMEFVSAVSHELRTPLAVIRSAGENLADGVVSDAEKMKRYGEVVRNEGRRLTEMVEQVLDYAGIESGRKPYRFQPVTVDEIVDRALEACESQIKERGFEVHRTGGPVSIHGDSSALTRALQNLVNNAIKYSGDSRWIGIESTADSGRVKISVTDHGLGISPPDLKHIWEPFFRGREATEAQIQGSGLGLSLVQEIVKAHGGSVEAVSTPGAGSRFTMILPIGA